MANILEALDDILKEVTEQVKITSTNPKGSLVRGTLVKHMEDLNTFGVVLDSYSTENKDIYNQEINYYNILWSNDTKNGQSFSKPLFVYGNSSIEPETELIAYHGFLLNK
tara:strand:+ start:730 stop:1059 length:330 start_codon:yes stop_codon:yes gene_type:complete